MDHVQKKFRDMLATFLVRSGDKVDGEYFGDAVRNAFEHDAQCQKTSDYERVDRLWLLLKRIETELRSE